MRLQNMLPYRALFSLVAGSIVAVRAQSDQTPTSGQKYCSNQNTGSSYGAGEPSCYDRPSRILVTDLLQVNDIYNSNGACATQCQGSYAFAVVQYQNCWCSNYAPANQVDTSQCNQQCPGYPDDLCGNANSGLYGYIALNAAPSGTQGAGVGSTQQSSSAQQSTPSIPATSSTTSTTPTTPTTSITPTTTPTTTIQPTTSTVSPFFLSIHLTAGETPASLRFTSYHP